MDSSRGSPGLGARRFCGGRDGSSGRLSRRASTGGIGAGCGAGIDLGPILQFVLAIDDHEVIGIQAGAQTDAVASSLRDGDDANFGGVAVGDGVDVGALGTALNGRRRNDSEIVLDVNEQMDIHKLIWKENVVFVAENGFELVGTGSGIDLVVNRSELAGS